MNHVDTAESNQSWAILLIASEGHRSPGGETTGARAPGGSCPGGKRHEQISQANEDQNHSGPLEELQAKAGEKIMCLLHSWSSGGGLAEPGARRWVLSWTEILNQLNQIGLFTENLWLLPRGVFEGQERGSSYSSFGCSDWKGKESNFWLNFPELRPFQDESEIKSGGRLLWTWAPQTLCFHKPLDSIWWFIA